MQTLLNIKDKKLSQKKGLEGVSKPISKKISKVTSNKIDFQLKLPKGDGEVDFILTKETSTNSILQFSTTMPQIQGHQYLERNITKAQIPSSFTPL